MCRFCVSASSLVMTKTYSSTSTHHIIVPVVQVIMLMAGALAPSDSLTAASVQQGPSDLIEVVSKVSSRDLLDRHVSKLIGCLANSAWAQPAASAELIAGYGGRSHGHLCSKPCHTRRGDGLTTSSHRNVLLKTWLPACACACACSGACSAASRAAERCRSSSHL
jgi:hypothetical protein